MIALTVLMHVAGLVALVALLRSGLLRSLGVHRYYRMAWLLVLTVLGIFAIHTVEIWAWALLYLWLGEFDLLQRALYFSTVTFTTLGYGDITVQERWQLLSSLEAANGIILFGVSTAFVFAVLKRSFALTAIVEADK